MRCHACDAPLDARGVFPGGTVRCACGAVTATPGVHGAPATHDPYRAPAPPPPPAPDAPPTARSRELGPLCPRCTRLLREDAERAALVCDACRGDFVDHASLSARVEAERPRGPARPAPHPPRFASREQDVRYAWCPGCGQVMARMTFGRRSGVVVDACRTHGTWFDAGELDAVLAFVRGGGLEEDVARVAPPVKADPARAMGAALEVELMHERQQDEDFAKDLVYLLFRPGHTWRRLW